MGSALHKLHANAFNVVMDIVIFIQNSKQQKRDIKDMTNEMNIFVYTIQPSSYTNNEKPGPNSSDPTQ